MRPAIPKAMVEGRLNHLIKRPRALISDSGLGSGGVFDEELVIFAPRQQADSKIMSDCFGVSNYFAREIRSC